jgi:hypothetical protein
MALSGALGRVAEQDLQDSRMLRMAERALLLLKILKS